MKYAPEGSALKSASDVGLAGLSLVALMGLIIVVLALETCCLATRVLPPGKFFSNKTLSSSKPSRVDL